MSKKVVEQLTKALFIEKLASEENAEKIVQLIKSRLELKEDGKKDKHDLGLTYSKIINGAQVPSKKTLRVRNARNIITNSFYKPVFTTYAQVKEARNTKILGEINARLDKLHEVGHLDLTTTSKLVVIK